MLKLEKTSLLNIGQFLMSDLCMSKTSAETNVECYMWTRDRQICENIAVAIVASNHSHNYNVKSAEFLYARLTRRFLRSSKIVITPGRKVNEYD